MPEMNGYVLVGILVAAMAYASAQGFYHKVVQPVGRGAKHVACWVKLAHCDKKEVK